MLPLRFPLSHHLGFLCSVCWCGYIKEGEEEGGEEGSSKWRSDSFRDEDDYDEGRRSRLPMQKKERGIDNHRNHRCVCVFSKN